MVAVGLTGMYGVIDRIIKSDVVSVAGGYGAVIDHCRRRHPHPQWDELAALDVDADCEALDGWFVDLLDNEPPPAEVTGIYFGLFNPTYEDGPAADVYAAGNRYDPDDADWACGPAWWPERRYAESDLLQDLYRIAYRPGGLGNDAEYPLCLAYAGLLLRDLSGRHADRLSAGVERVLCTGFDSGDILCVGAVGRSGLVLSASAERFVPA